MSRKKSRFEAKSKRPKYERDQEGRDMYRPKNPELTLILFLKMKNRID